MKQKLLLLGLLVAVWAALSGHYSTEPLIFGFGVLSVLFVWLVMRRMARLDQGARFPVTAWGLLLRNLAYLPYLLKEVVLANLTVARFALGSRRGWRPQVLRIRASQRSELGRVVFANSITLTPGTVTLDVSGDELLVHALGPDSASALISGEMDRRVTRIEGSGQPAR